jgi:hypothetical protein
VSEMPAYCDSSHGRWATTESRYKLMLFIVYMDRISDLIPKNCTFGILKAFDSPPYRGVGQLRHGAPLLVGILRGCHEPEILRSIS